MKGGKMCSTYGFKCFSFHNVLIGPLPCQCGLQSSSSSSQASNTRVADFLSRNFDDEGARRAAAKNAFALLGLHK